MKLLFVSNLFPSSVEPDRGLFNLQLLKAIRAAGHDVQVIAPVFRPVPTAWLKRLPLPRRHEQIGEIPVMHPVFRYPPGLFRRQHHLFYRQAVKPAFSGMLRQFEPDHVILGFAYPDAAAMAPICQRAGVRHSVRINGSDFRLRTEDPKLRTLVLKTLREAGLVFCPGKTLKNEMVAAGVPAQSIVSFNNGVDHAQFTPGQAKKLEEDDVTVLFVGHLKRVKGADLLIRAWAALRKPTAYRQPESQSLTLNVVGSGPLRRRLERLAAELGVSDSIRFAGNVLHEDVAQIMRDSRCLVLPSRSEGMPNVVLEALACGIPVVATDVGEVPYLVREGVNGYVVHKSQELAPIEEPEIIINLAQKIGEVIARPWDREDIAATVKDFTWERAAQTVIAAIEEKADTEPRE